MPVKTDATKKIVAYVAAHQGCTRAELLEHCQAKHKNWAMPTYCVKSGFIFASGPHGSQRYFTDEELAKASHKEIADAVEAEKVKKRRDGWLRDNARKMQRRREKRPQVVKQIKARNEARRRARALLPKDVKIPHGVKITVAKPLMDRWAA